MRIILANEPRAYREALAGALWELRPAVEVIEISPEALAEAVESLRPRLVLCSRLPHILPGGPKGWIELYPDGSSDSRVILDGHAEALQGPQLEDLISIVDRVTLYER